MHNAEAQPPHSVFHLLCSCFILHSPSSGLCFGLAFLMKQHGIFYGLFALAFVLWSERGHPLPGGNWQPAALAAFCAAFALPFTALCLTLLWAGTFRQFVFLDLYLRQPIRGRPNSFGGVVQFEIHPALRHRSRSPLWGLSLVGIVLVVLTKPVAGRAFLLGFTVSSLLAVCPGLSFRPDYFILLLPGLGGFGRRRVESLASF